MQQPHNTEGSRMFGGGAFWSWILWHLLDRGHLAASLTHLGEQLEGFSGWPSWEVLGQCKIPPWHKGIHQESIMESVLVLITKLAPALWDRHLAVQALASLLLCLAALIPGMKIQCDQIGNTLSWQSRNLAACPWDVANLLHDGRWVMSPLHVHFPS